MSARFTTLRSLSVLGPNPSRVLPTISGSREAGNGRDTDGSGHQNLDGILAFLGTAISTVRRWLGPFPAHRTPRHNRPSAPSLEEVSRTRAWKRPAVSLPGVKGVKGPDAFLGCHGGATEETSSVPFSPDWKLFRVNRVHNSHQRSMLGVENPARLDLPSPATYSFSRGRPSCRVLGTCS